MWNYYVLFVNVFSSCVNLYSRISFVNHLLKISLSIYGTYVCLFYFACIAWSMLCTYRLYILKCGSLWQINEKPELTVINKFHNWHTKVNHCNMSKKYIACTKFMHWLTIASIDPTFPASKHNRWKISSKASFYWQQNALCCSKAHKVLFW